MKKIISLVLAALMLTILSVPAFAADTPTVVSPAPEAPTPITNAEEFLAMESGKTYILANDIDFGGKVFSEIMITGGKFIAGLDGDGHAIKNFKFEATDHAGDLAIFQQLGGGYIKNLSIGTVNDPLVYKVNNPTKGTYAILAASTQNKDQTPEIDNVHIYTKTEILFATTTVKMQFGCFIGFARNYKITNSTLNGEITVKNSVAEPMSVYRNVGGFIGADKENWSVGLLENCENNASITHLDNAAEARVAGFIGYTDKFDTTIKNCTNNGAIHLATSAGAGYAGGIIGTVNTAAGGLMIIDGCVNNGIITYECNNEDTDKLKTFAGGIIAGAQRGAITVTNCQNTVLFDSTAANNLEIIGGNVDGGSAFVDEANNKTTADMTVIPADPNLPVVTNPVDTDPADTTAPVEDTKAPETEPSSPSTGDHSLVIILLAAFMSVVGAAFAFIARREN